MTPGLRIFRPAPEAVLPPAPEVDQRLIMQLDAIFSSGALRHQWQKVDAIVELIHAREQEMRNEK